MSNLTRCFARSAVVLLLGMAMTGAGATPTSRPADDHPVDGVVVVVSPLNPVTSLTRNQVTDIFLGRSRQFPSGDLALPIDQAEGSAPRRLFNERVLGRSAAQVRSHWSKVLFTGRGRPPQVVAGSDAVILAIAADARAIGYIERSQVTSGVVVVLE